MSYQDEKYTYAQAEGFTMLDHIPDENTNWTHVQDHNFGGRYDTQFRPHMTKRNLDENETWQKSQMITEDNQVPTYASHPSQTWHTDVAGHLGQVYREHDHGPLVPIRSDWAVDKNNPNMDIGKDSRIHMMGHVDTQNQNTPATARQDMKASFDHSIGMAPWTDGLHTFYDPNMETSTGMVYGNKENEARMPGGGPMTALPRYRDEEDTTFAPNHKETYMTYRPQPSMPQSNEMHHMVGESDMAIMDTKAYLEHQPDLPQTTTFQFDTYHTGQMDDTDLKVVEPDTWF